MGRRKLIESPEEFWDLFIGYEKETKSNPILVHDFVGKDVESVRRERERPLTMEGFEDYCCEHSKINYPDLTEYFEGKNESYKDYFPVSSRIRRRIRKDQIEGGMAMIYSQSITARLNSLVDKQENTVKVEQPLFGDGSN